MAAIHVMMLILGLAAWHMAGVAGDCCSDMTFYPTTAQGNSPGGTFVVSPINYGFEKKWQQCADCSEGTPYCGKGDCNIFGCACKGGCRTGSNTCYCFEDSCVPPIPCPTCQQKSTADRIIKMADVDQDGRLSYEEARAHLGMGGNSSVNHSSLQALDINKDGFFTGNEIDLMG